jgi:hypothetical protein
MGYNTIVFESGFMIIIELLKNIRKKLNISFTVKRFWNMVWHKSIQNLMDYIDERAKQNDPIKIWVLIHKKGLYLKSFYGWFHKIIWK